MVKKNQQPTTSDLRVRNKGVRRVRVADLVDAAWNHRLHPEAQAAALDGAIDELGFYGFPDVFEADDGSLVLIDGHLRKQRLIAKYGLDAEIEVNVTDFDEAEAKKANLTKDPLAAMAESSRAALDELLKTVETESEALHELLAGMASVPIIDLPPPPESIQENVKDIEAIKAQRKKGNEGIASKNDTEKYLVIVYGSREEKDTACAALGLPDDERYVSASFVEVKRRGVIRSVQIGNGRDAKAASRKKSGAGG